MYINRSNNAISSFLRNAAAEVKEDEEEEDTDEEEIEVEKEAAGVNGVEACDDPAPGANEADSEGKEVEAVRAGVGRLLEVFRVITACK